MSRKFLTSFALATALLAGAVAAPASAGDFKAEVKYAEVNGVKLAYYMRGQGKPLVMINGFISTMGLWDPLLVEDLSKSHQLILFDNRGVGLSTDTAENNTTIPQMADDAAGLIAALGLKQPDVLGWSMGARIAQQLVIRHPDAVGKLVLAAPNPGGSHSVPADKDVEDKLNDPALPMEGKIGLVFPPEVGGVKAGQEIFARILEAGKNGTAPNDFVVSKRTTERQDRARTTLWRADQSNFENLKSVKIPVLVTDGRYDLIDKPVNALIIARQIPFAWLAYYDGGHAFLFQQHAQFTATVDAFLQDPAPTP
ncbi:alpha/beta fold hydrolase [Aestuariivirga sp.]|uniref:alpha/beta fold hydrolase n=1 Tax=Aestuariivirga sp. TaxID=2650926 RepID=UPI0035B0367A